MESLDHSAEKFTSEVEEREKAISGEKKKYSAEDFLIFLFVNK